MSQIKEIQEDELDLLDLISILIKNFRIIFFITLFSMLSIVILSVISIKIPAEKSFLPNEFSPTSSIMLNSNQEGGGISSLIASSGMSSLASLAGISSSGVGLTDSALAIKLVKTSGFIDKISSEFSLAKVYETYNKKFPKTEIKKILGEKLILSEDEKTGMLEISYTDIDKVLATNIVNRVTGLLEEEFAKIDKIRNKDQFGVITDKISVVEADLERIQEEIIEFQTRNNMMDVSVVSTALVEQMTEFQSALLRKEVEIESYGRVSNVKDPGYQKLINEREAIRSALVKLENGEVGDYPPVKDLPQLALELASLKREAEVKMIAYKALIQQSETLKLTEGGTGSTFQVLEYAEIPEMKSGPSRGKLCIIVTFAGFFFSIFFVFLKEAWLNIKNDPEKMKKLRGEK